jgi:hypothetical protein
MMNKKGRTWVFGIILILLLCCLLPLGMISYDSEIYPLWVDIIAPHPERINEPEPLLITYNIGNNNDLAWSKDGSSVTLFHNSGTNMPLEPGQNLITFDSFTGEILEYKNEVIQYNPNILFQPWLKSSGDENGVETIYCHEKRLAVKELEESVNEWQLTLLESNETVSSFAFSPVHKYQYYTRYLVNESFSPDCNYFILTIIGWAYYEAEAREELWLLDTQAKSFRPIVIGRWPPFFRFWDYPVQDVMPGWSPDGKKLVFGDSIFGMEIYDINSGVQSWLSSPKRSGWEPEWSYTGQWIDSIYYEDNPAITVMAPDGKKTANADGCSIVFTVAWSPVDNRLAYLCLDPKSLWIWTLEN